MLQITIYLISISLLGTSWVRPNLERPCSSDEVVHCAMQDVVLLFCRKGISGRWAPFVYLGQLTNPKIDWAAGTSGVFEWTLQVRICYIRVAQRWSVRRTIILCKDALWLDPAQETSNDYVYFSYRTMKNFCTDQPFRNWSTF